MLNANTGKPGRGTLATPQFQLIGGQRAISETYTASEPIVLVAHDDAGNAPATSNVITITPGAPSAVRLASSPSWVGGDKHATVTARVVDAYENGVPDRAVSFAMISGTGSLTPSDSLTDENGNTRADFLSPRTIETDRVRATSGSFSQDLDRRDLVRGSGAPAAATSPTIRTRSIRRQPTTLAYKLDDQAAVTVRIFTQAGDLVRRFQFSPGTQGGAQGLNQCVWDGRNGDGQLVSSGGYLVLIEAQGAGSTLNVIRRKIAVVR